MAHHQQNFTPYSSAQTQPESQPPIRLPPCRQLLAEVDARDPWLVPRSSPPQFIGISRHNIHRLVLDFQSTTQPYGATFTELHTRWGSLATLAGFVDEYALYNYISSHTPTFLVINFNNHPNQHYPPFVLPRTPTGTIDALIKYVLYCYCAFIMANSSNLQGGGSMRDMNRLRLRKIFLVGENIWQAMVSFSSDSGGGPGA